MKMSSREAEGMLAAAFGIEDGRLLRFRGRLDHLRRHGCPSGTNTGKGRAAVFGWGQLVELTIALTLLDLGISPEHAARVVKENELSIRIAVHQLVCREKGIELAVASAKKWKWPAKNSVFLIGSVFALAGMRDDDAIDRPLVVVADYRQLLEHFEEANFTEASGFVVDLGTRVATLILLVGTWSRGDLKLIVEDLKQWVEEATHSGIWG